MSAGLWHRPFRDLHATPVLGARAWPRRRMCGRVCVRICARARRSRGSRRIAAQGAEPRGPANRAFGDATVRQVMDMTTGLAYSEDYSNPAPKSGSTPPLATLAETKGVWRRALLLRVPADGEATGPAWRGLRLQDGEHRHPGLDASTPSTVGPSLPGTSYLRGPFDEHRVAGADLHEVEASLEADSLDRACGRRRRLSTRRPSPRAVARPPHHSAVHTLRYSRAPSSSCQSPREGASQVDVYRSQPRPCRPSHE